MRDDGIIMDTLGMCMMIYILTYMCLLAYETRYVTHEAHAGGYAAEATEARE